MTLSLDYHHHKWKTYSIFYILSVGKKEGVKEVYRLKHIHHNLLVEKTQAVNHNYVEAKGGGWSLQTCNSFHGEV